MLYFFLRHGKIRERKLIKGKNTVCRTALEVLT